jgi:Uma2 family endonuclease
MPATTTIRRPRRKVAAPAAAIAPVLVDALGDQRLLIDNLDWSAYVGINDAIVERPNLKMVYCDRRLTLVSKGLRHNRYASRLGCLVNALAAALKMRWEIAASATFRKPEKRVGVEGDGTFYFGPHADIMKGPKDIDLDTQPPPDLAIEVEVSRSADDAVIVWGRLGVPEVWRFDPIAWECSFRGRHRNATYGHREMSLAFPTLKPDDVIEQMRLADELGTGEWYARLPRWVRKVIVPRKRKGA